MQLSIGWTAQKSKLAGNTHLIKQKHNTLKTMNLYHIKLTDNQKDALERLFNMGIVWSKTELSEAWEQLREQVREASCTVAIINALQDSECNCKKPTEPAPEYDPNRKFRKGDKVRFQKVNNRFTHELVATLFVGTLGRVAFVERESGAVKVLCFDGVLRVVDANYLELVTPVEEVEPYVVGETTDYFSVDKDDEELSLYWKDKHPNAKAAAEAERDRLNAE